MKLFSFIIILWWVFLIIVAVLFLIWAWQTFFDFLAMLFSEDKWERYFAIGFFVIAVLFILLLRSC